MANEVEVKITASTDALSAGMNDATNKVQSAAADINRIADSIKTAFNGVRDSLKNIDISLNIDMSGLDQRLASATSTIRTRINNIADDAAIKLKIDTASLNIEIEQAETLIRSRLSSLPIQNVSLDIDVNEIRRKLNQLNTQQVKLKLGLDLSTLQVQMQQAKTTITSTLQTTFARAIQITVNLPLLATQLSRARTMINTALTQLRNSNINLNTVINIDATSNLLRGSLDRLKTSIDLLRIRMNSGGGSGGGGSGGGSGGGGSGGGSGNGLGTSIVGNFLANMASELVMQIGALTGEVIRNAREIENMSRLANATTQEFQEWAFASNSVGISQEKLGDIMKDVNDKFGDFMQTGGGEMADFFEKVAPKVGLTAKEFQGLSGPQILGKYYEALKKANVSQAEMTFYMESIANDAMLLSPLLDDNAKKLKEYSKQAHDLGVILDEDAIQGTKNFESSLNLIAATIKGVVGRAIAGLAPHLKGMADNFLSSSAKSKDAIDGSISAIVVILESLTSNTTSLLTLIGDIWKDLTADIGDSSIQQIGFMDLVSGALKGFAAAAVGLRVGIEIAFAVIRAVVATVCQAINLAVNTVINVFGGFRDTIQYGLDVLSIKFQTFGSVVSNVLNFNFSAAKASWESGLSQLGATTDRYTNQMQSRLTNLKTSWQNTALGVTTAVSTLGQSIVDSATKGGGKLSNLFLGSPKSGGSTNPPPPTFDPNRGIGTGVKPTSGGSSKSKSDADAKARERAAEQLAKAIADIRYKYASEEEKIALDLKKALEEIDKSKVSDAEKAKFKVVAEKEASDKRIALSVEEFEKIKVIREAEIENKFLQAQRIYDIEKSNIQAAFDAKKISNVEKVRLEKELEDQLREVKRRGLQERLDLEEQMSARSGKTGNQHQISNSISDLDTDKKVSDTQMTGLMSDAQMQDFETKFGDLTSRMSGLWDKGIQSMMDGTLTWKNATNAIYTELAGAFLQNMVTEPLKKYLASMAPRLAAKLGLIKAETLAETMGQTAQVTAVVAGEGVKTAATSAGVLTRLGIKLAGTLKAIMMSAWEAMAAAWAAMSAIPIIGPALGVAAGIAAFAGVSAIVGKVASARGGYDIPSGVNPMTQLHEEEMVLPKQHANTIRAIGKSMTGGELSQPTIAGGSGGMTTLNIQAWDSKDVKRFLKKHGREVAGGLKGYNRNFGK